MLLTGLIGRTESRVIGAVVAGFVMSTIIAPAAALEERTYVVSWFSQAVSNQEGDCAGGINPDVGTQYEKNLVALGKAPEEAKELVQRWLAGKDNGVLRDLMSGRARIDGKSVNAYAHPAAVVDPELNSVTGNIAYGFDLDGKGSDDPDGFLEPDTGNVGIDNQLFRALGCSRAFRGTKEESGAFWDFVWVTVKDTMPAWLMTIEGEDLDSDGPVKIIFDRALEHAKSNPDGDTRPYMTYRVDPDPRSHNEFRGEIKEGVLSITEPARFSMLQSIMYAPEINLRETHLRMNIHDNGNIEGFIGGYQPWREIYFGLAWGGTAAEVTVTGELPGLFYLLQRHADALPDPQTGENTEISAAYRLQAVPAFHVNPIEAQAAVPEH